MVIDLGAALTQFVGTAALSLQDVGKDKPGGGGGTSRRHRLEGNQPNQTIMIERQLGEPP